MNDMALTQEGFQEVAIAGRNRCNKGKVNYGSDSCN